MKMKKIVNLCKSSGHMYLYNGDVQMLGDGKSLYYLDDCPKFTPATLCSAHDITEKQAEKMIFKFESCPPAAFSVHDVLPDETLCEPFSTGIAIRAKRYTAYRTSQGVAFVDEKYLEPFFADGDVFEVYEREADLGQIYFAVKIGMFLEAIVLPDANVINETLLAELDELCGLCDIAYDNAQRDNSGVKFEPESGQIQMEEV